MKARDSASARTLGAGALFSPSIRVRLTAWVTLVVGLIAIAVYIAGLALVRKGHVNDLTSDLIRVDRHVAGLTRAGLIGDPLIAEGLVQVVEADGTVIASSRRMAGYPAVNFSPPPPMLNQRQGRSCEVTAPGGRCHLIVVQRVRKGPTEYLVYALAPEPGLFPRPEIALAGLTAVPAVAALAGYLTWQGIGRVLRHVDAIRSELDEITATDIERRVPVPDRNEEIARLAESVNATLDRLEGAVARLRGFVSDVSHELRSPLTGLRMELELALSDPEGADTLQTLEAVLLNAERLHAVLDDLLAIASLEADPAIAKEQIDLQQLTDQEVLNRPRRSRFTVHGGDPIMVRGGRAELARLLNNLLDNAERHAESEVTVTLTLEPNDGAGAAGSPRTAVVEICDDGPGVSPADRERVFERFTRLAEGRHRDAGGTGLGLAIARDIATAHGGSLILTDRPDGKPGARFVLRLPAL